jgi:O-antigen/teichoic acid export membrane protein
VPLIFGGRFRPAVWPAEILLLASLFKGAEQVLGGGAGALGNPWLSSKANLTALVITGGLLYALLPTLGIMGAAIASAAAYLAELSVVLYGLHRTHSISTLSLFRVGRANLAEGDLH